MNARLHSMSRWTTTSRLLQLGENISFDFYLPAGSAPHQEASQLTVFPRYLDMAEPGDAFVAGGDLAWLDELESEQFPLGFSDRHAGLTYTPSAPGSYIALWDVPATFSLDRSRIATSAKDFILACNTDGEFHLVLLFDLRPDAELTVTVTD